MARMVEDPWTVLLVCIAVGVAVEIVCSQISQHAMLLGFLGILAFSGLLFGIERYVVTDKEQVEEMLHSAAEAVASGDFTQVRPYLVKRSLPIEYEARSWVESYKVKDVKLSELKIALNMVSSPPTAHVELWARVELEPNAMYGGLSGPHVVRVSLELEREEGQWRVAEAKVKK